jgi:predicted RNase H-like HicB family nuclease
MMATLFFPALFEPASDGGFGVFFPDVPGCTSGGDDFDAAVRNAIEGLQFHLDGLREEGLPIPKPSTSFAWPRWAGRRPKGVQAALIPAEVADAAVRLNITMDKGLLARIDRAAEAEGMTRSGYLAQAARERLAATRAPKKKPKRAA